jgi:hypothetical protein
MIEQPHFPGAPRRWTLGGLPRATPARATQRVSHKIRRSALKTLISDSDSAPRPPLVDRVRSRFVSIVRALGLVNGLDARSLRRCAKRRLAGAPRSTSAPQRPARVPQIPRQTIENAQFGLEP